MIAESDESERWDLDQGALLEGGLCCFLFRKWNLARSRVRTVGSGLFSARNRKLIAAAGLSPRHTQLVGQSPWNEIVFPPFY